MTEPSASKIPFQIDLDRVIDVLAREIYQSPLALLRENAQNAFDAILLRRMTDPGCPSDITIEITPTQVIVTDTGVGMTRDQLTNNFWHPGSSTKNTKEARDAGVVGTFGIGAIANFGIATELAVTTESAVSGERTRSTASRSTLSLTESTIDIIPERATGHPGTTIVAQIDPGKAIQVAEAEQYAADFLSLVPMTVTINGRHIDRLQPLDLVPATAELGPPLKGAAMLPGLIADVTITTNPFTGDAWVKLEHIDFHGAVLTGSIVLRQGAGPIRTFRSGFGLAPAGVVSVYRFGGVADLLQLEPTAGREALTSQSLQLLQTIVTGADAVTSRALSLRAEANSSTPFMEWVRQHAAFDLCDNLTVRVEGAVERPTLAVLRASSEISRLNVYSGNDPEIIAANASRDSRLVVVARDSPRRQCELEYLKRYCSIDLVSDVPSVVDRKPVIDWTVAEHALVTRLEALLASDYFVSASVSLAQISHGVPVLASAEGPMVHLVLDPTAATCATVLTLFDKDYESFGSMVKDFARTVVFPRIADYVPSSTREGAEAFLKSIRRRADIFEVGESDLGDFRSIWGDWAEGKISLEEATTRSSRLAQTNVQVVDAAAARPVSDVLPDLADVAGPALGPAPPIMRREVTSDAKMLVVPLDAPAMREFGCLIALSDRAYEERGALLLQPHSTSIVWSGQRVLFVFEHQSGIYGVYYDLTAPLVVAASAGGGMFPTATLVLKNRIYIPVPREISGALIPGGGQRNRFEVTSEFLRIQPTT